VFSSQTCEIEELTYYQNYRFDSNKILSWWSKYTHYESKMADSCHLGKIEKLPRFDRFWQTLARWRSLSLLSTPTVKI